MTEKKVKKVVKRIAKLTKKLEEILAPQEEEVIEVIPEVTHKLLGPEFADIILPDYPDELSCINAILDGSVIVNGQECHLPWTVDSKGEKLVNMLMCPGHIYSQPQVKGPVPAPIMVIGKMPRPADVLDEDDQPLRTSQCLSVGSHAGQFFLDTAINYGVSPDNWYVTYLMKSLHPEDPNKGSRLKAGWLKECFPIIQYEITQVAPSYILVFGAEAVKSLFGHAAKITDLTGTVLDYHYTDYNGNPKVAKCVACTSPHAVVRSSDTEEQAKYNAAFKLFCNLLSGGSLTEPYHHLEIRTMADWQLFLKLVEAECTDNILALDGEWSGQHPQNADAQLRTIQFSWKDNTAAALIWTDVEGNYLFTPQERMQIKADFYRLWMSHIIAGHFLDSDAETLIYHGFIPQLYDIPEIPATGEEYRARCKAGLPCLFDTALAAHAYDETANHSLNGQYSLRLPSVPRYETGIIQWRKQYCKANKIKDSDLPGYAPCPDDVLVYYGCYDADVTRRLAVWYINNLHKDAYGLDCWDAFANSMQQWPAFLEMNCTGLHVNRPRMDELTDLYKSKYDALVTKIRQDAAWPGFNINSSYQMRELLFGEQHNQAKSGGFLRPAGATSLYLTPLYTTEGMPWEKAMKDKNLATLAVPACNARTLSMLATQFRQEFDKTQDKKFEFISNLLTNLRSAKILGKALSYVLKDAIVESDGTTTERGLASFICSDGKLRTHLYMTLDSGRAASARPAMQNISQKREADYERIVGKDKYIAPLRSILTAPAGHMLISADFLGAELAAAGILSNDATMMEHVRRNTLPEDDPDYYDIHSGLTVAAFRLQCEPTKKALERLGKAHLRVVAKSIIFGLMYGRGAAAIAEAVKEEGVFVTIDEVKQIINVLKKLYPQVMDFLQEAANSVYDPGYIVGVAGRYRRKPKHEYLPNDKLAELERVFKNFTAQNFVAEAMRGALSNLWKWRFEHDDDFNICLQVHDEVVLTAPYSHVERVVDVVIPACLSENNKLWARKLTGEVITDRGPYSLGCDVDVGFNYGIALKDWRETCQKMMNQQGTGA